MKTKVTLFAFLVMAISFSNFSTDNYSNQFRKIASSDSDIIFDLLDEGNDAQEKEKENSDDCIECRIQELNEIYLKQIAQIMSSFNSIIQGNNSVLAALGQSNYQNNSVFGTVDQMTSMLMSQEKTMNQMQYGLYPNSNSLSNAVSSQNELPAFIEGNNTPAMQQFVFTNPPTREEEQFYARYGTFNYIEAPNDSDPQYQRFSELQDGFHFQNGITSTDNQLDIMPYQTDII